MVKSAKKMESAHVSLYTLFAAIAAGLLIYAGYRHYKKYRTENCRNGVSPRPMQTRDGKSLTELKSKCWETYVELETLRSLKSKCAKVVAGDISVTTAIKQLDTILKSDKNVEYMAPRIIGQVCDFIINMATANKMIDNDGKLIMPKASPNLRDQNSYYDNIQVAPVDQIAKYEAVIKYQSQEIFSEKSNMKFVHILQEILPSLQEVCYLSHNEDKLSPIEIVGAAEKMYKELSPILLKHESQK